MISTPLLNTQPAFAKDPLIIIQITFPSMGLLSDRVASVLISLIL